MAQMDSSTPPAIVIEKPQETTPSPAKSSSSSKVAFKVPLPPAKSSRTDSLNAFPMLNGPQRAGAGSGRRKIPLAPGYSPLDWSRLATSNTNLRGVSQLSRYTLDEVAQHKHRDDLWMAIQGKVYNITHYLKFHPGGAAQLTRGAGKDATDLFMSIHPWVNIDALLDKCQVGYLVKA